MKSNIFLTSLFALITTIMLGQKVKSFDYYKKLYGGQNIVNTLEKDVLSIRYNKNGEPYIELYTEESKLYLSENAANYSKDAVDYSEHYILKEIEAMTLVPFGTKYKKQKVENFSTKTEFSSGIFHNGTESINFIYPSLQKGAISTVKYSTELTIPQLLSSFYISSYYPTDKRIIRIEVAKGIELGFTIINAEGPAYEPVVTETKKKTIYEWTFDQVAPFEVDQNAPKISYYVPHIIPRIKRYKNSKSGEEVTLLNETKDLYNWYHSLINKTDKSPSPQLKSIVDSLVLDIKDDQEKIKRIYYWVQDNIRYVAFEEGMEGFIPEDGHKVCDKRYGDCKGLSSIMYSMMTYAGVDAYFTWVGTRDRPYSYITVPTPVVDNHMILTYKYNGKYYSIDGTSNRSPFDESPYFIQGKEVLVGLTEDEFKVIEVPVKPASYSTFTDSVFIKLTDDDKLKGIGSAAMTGYYNTASKNRLALVPTDKLEESMERFLEKGSNKFVLDTFQVSDLNNREETLKIEYEFSLSDYVQRNEKELYINLNLKRIDEENDLSPKRKTPVEIEFKSTNRLVTVLEIPSGYKATFLPDSVRYDKGKFGFTYDVKQQGNQIIQTFSLYDNYLILEKDSFKDWNKMIRSLKKVYREAVIIEKI